MRRNVGASMLTWGLAIFFVGVFDVALTSESLLWAPTSFEHTRDMAGIMFAHTYQAARRIYAQRKTAPVRVALLGNSRIWLPAREAYLRRELDRTSPGLDARIDNLGIFGARLGDFEVLSRHLGRLDPTLVVLAVSGKDLVARPAAPLRTLPARLMRVGWGDGPLPPSGAGERLDRWARTVWPLFRFREFTRTALAERLHPGVAVDHFPDRFETTRALFDYMHGAKGAVVERAYRAWRAEPSLERFVAYLRLGSSGYLGMVRDRVTNGVRPYPGGPALRVLEALLDRLGSGPWKAMVILMPENPLVSEDTDGRYHWPGFSDDGARLIRDAARRHRVSVIDGRRWMPADAFIDFDHLMPDLSGFQVPFDREILRAVRS